MYTACHCGGLSLQDKERVFIIIITIIIVVVHLKFLHVVLQGRVRDSDLAELNSRIQATAFQPAAIKQQPITCKAAPAMPICPLGDKAVQNSARDGSTSPLALMESNGFLLLQSASAAGRDLETDGVLGAGGISIPGAWGGCHKAMNGKPAGGGSVQLVKLTGTTNVGLRA